MIYIAKIVNGRIKEYHAYKSLTELRQAKNQKCKPLGFVFHSRARAEQILEVINCLSMPEEDIKLDKVPRAKVPEDVLEYFEKNLF